MFSRRQSDAADSNQLRPPPSSSMSLRPIALSKKTAKTTQTVPPSTDPAVTMTNITNLRPHQPQNLKLFHSSSQLSLHPLLASCSTDPVEDTSASACFLPVAQSLVRKLEQEEDIQSSASLSEPSDDHSDRRYSDFSQGSLNNQSLELRQRTHIRHTPCNTAAPALICSQTDPKKNISASIPSMRCVEDHHEQLVSSSNHSHIKQPALLRTNEQISCESPSLLTRQPRCPKIEPRPDHMLDHGHKPKSKQLSTASVPSQLSPEFHCSASLPYLRCHTSVTSKMTQDHTPMDNFGTAVDSDHMFNSTPYCSINPTPRPQPVRPAAQEPAPSRKRINAFWKFLSSRARPRRPRRRVNDVVPPHPSPNSPSTTHKRDWMTESFRLLRRSNNFPSERVTPVPSTSGSTTASVTVSATSSNTIPTTLSGSQVTLSQASVPTTPISPSRTFSRTRRIKQPSHAHHSTRTRSSNTSCSSATVDASLAPSVNGISQKHTNGDSSFSSMPTLLRTRPVTFADAREPKSLGNFRGRFVITTEGSSISSCSDREDDALSNPEAQHLLLSRRQMHAMQFK